MRCKISLEKKFPFFFMFLLKKIVVKNFPGIHATCIFFTHVLYPSYEINTGVRYDSKNLIQVVI